MPWTTPITWPVGAPSTTQFNQQIRDNMVRLHMGNGQDSSPTPLVVAADKTLDIGAVEAGFFVNASSYNLAFISTAGRPYFNEISIVSSAVSGAIDYGASSPPAGYAPIYANGAATSSGVTWPQYRVIHLTFIGTAWCHDFSVTW